MKKKKTFMNILPIIIIGLIVIFSILAVISIGKILTKKLGNQTSQQSSSGGPTNGLRDALLMLDNSRSVRMTIRGPIVAEENFRSYQITVGLNRRSISIYKGYLGELIKNNSYDNNLRAYEEFVNALDKANFAKGRPFEDEDIAGICATGTVTEFDVLQNGVSLAHLWTSTCKGSPGSLEASTSQLKNLFLRQIPDVSNFLKAAGIK